MAKFSDWEIVDPQSYEDAHLYSKQGRFSQPLWMRIEQEHQPVYNEAFHYPEDCTPLGLAPTGNFAGEQAPDLNRSQPAKSYRLRKFAAN